MAEVKYNDGDEINVEMEPNKQPNKIVAIQWTNGEPDKYNEVVEDSLHEEEVRDPMSA